MTEESIRLDRWLFHARFIKQRTLAARLIAKRRVRVNDRLMTKAHFAVRSGDVLTLVRQQDVIVLRVLGLGERRGPAPEAQALYEILEAL